MEHPTRARVPLGWEGLPGTVSDVADVGTSFELFVSLAAGLEIVARTTERWGFEPDDPCRVDLPGEAIGVWLDEQGRTEAVAPR